MIQSDHDQVDTERREAVLEALLRAAKELHAPDVPAAVERSLGVVARALQADVARLIRFTVGSGETFSVRCCVEWRAPTLASTACSEPVARTMWDKPDAVYSMEKEVSLCRHVDQLSGAERRAFQERGVAATILCPVWVGGTLWGGIELVQRAPANATWSDEEAWLLDPYAEHLAALIETKGAEALTASADDRDDEQRSVRKTSNATDVQALQLQRRVRAERALVEASKLLVSTDPFEMEDLLRIVGEATGADYAYLVTIRPEEGYGPSPLVPQEEERQPPIDLAAYAHYEWYATGAARSQYGEPPVLADEPMQPENATFAVPILSSQNALFGYLGIDFEDEASPLQDEDVRVLNVLGDMLCTYLQRQVSDRALRKSEQRYRHFVDTISEAIWRVDFDPPLATDQSVEEQIAAMVERGTIAECNEEFARLFDIEAPQQLTGWSVARLTEFTGRRIVRDVIDAGFQLQSQEYVVYDEDRASRHFIVNTSGLIEDDQLVSVWGSTTEVTERVQLERRMVTALEQQQQRIGRDLHDSVGQLLTGVRMLAQNLEERYFGDGVPGNEQVHKIIGYAEEAAKHVSDLQRGLMPVQMERGGLAQALQELASNTDVLPEVDCIYVVDGATDVRNQEKKLQLYRIAQEATNNALKHAQPSYIKIALKTDDDAVILEIEDDGVGFDTTQVDKKSLGLHSMYYRARSINADLQVYSEPECGTTVRCAVERQEIDNDHEQ